MKARLTFAYVRLVSDSLRALRGNRSIQESNVTGFLSPSL